MEMGLGEEGARGVDTASSHEAAMQGLTVQQTHGIGYTKSLVRLRGGISVSVQTSDGIRKWIKAIVVNNAKTPGILEQVLGPLGKEPQKVRDGPTWTVQHPSGVVLSLVGTVELKLGADVNAKSTTFHVWSCEANVKPHIGIFFSEDTIPKDVVRKGELDFPPPVLHFVIKKLLLTFFQLVPEEAKARGLLLGHSQRPSTLATPAVPLLSMLSLGRPFMMGARGLLSWVGLLSSHTMRLPRKLPRRLTTKCDSTPPQPLRLTTTWWPMLAHFPAQYFHPVPRLLRFPWLIT